MISENKLSPNYRSIALLFIGSLIGISSLFLVPNKLLGYDQGAVAQINNAVIRKDEYERAIALFRGDKRGHIFLHLNHLNHRRQGEGHIEY